MFSWVTLQNLVEWTQGKLSVPSDLKLPIRSFSSDTRTLKNGEVFIALKGENFDGNDYLKLATEKGASLLIAERAADGKVPTLVVKDSLRAWVEIAAALRRKFQGPVVAVTGSAGKSSTKDILATLLGPDTLKSPKSFNNLLGTSKTLCLLEDSTRHLVLEMGMNARGEIKAMCEAFHPQGGVITNIGDAHIGRLGGREGIYEAKKELFDHLAENRSKTIGIAVNLDDPLVVKAASLAFKEPARRLTYSATHAEADIFISRREVARDTGFLNLELSSGSEKVEVTLPHFGLHQAYNFAAAVAMARLLEVSWADIRARSKLIVPSDQRGQFIPLESDMRLVDESYNSNPSALKSALASVLEVDKTRRHVLVVGGMGELEPFHETLHREVGEALVELLDRSPVKVVLVGVGPHISYFLEPVREKLPQVPTHLLKDVEAAIAEVPKLLLPGDLILVKGSRSIALDRLVKILRPSA